MSEADDRTQLICDPNANATCGCTDGEEYTCDCDPNEAGTECTGCSATLVRIDMDTGEPVGTP